MRFFIYADIAFAVSSVMFIDEGTTRSEGNTKDEIFNAVHDMLC